MVKTFLRFCRAYPSPDCASTVEASSLGKSEDARGRLNVLFPQQETYRCGSPLLILKIFEVSVN